MEFYIDRLEPNGLVVGWNGDADIPVGTIFTVLGGGRVDGEPPHLSSVYSGKVAAIDLRLTEVHWFRKTIDAIPRGHSAGLRLEGNGLDTIADALAFKRKREFIFMRV